MKKVITVLFLWIILPGCKTKQEPVSFMLLEKHSGKKPSSFSDDRYTYIYREVYLIDNLPERIQKKGIDEKRYNLEFNFFKENHKMCLLEDDITEYNVRFYRKTSCTRYFIDNFNDYGGFSRSTLSEDCRGDGEYSFYYERDNDNLNMWTNPIVALYWDKKYRDTIYCEPNRKTVKLPDMPRP